MNQSKDIKTLFHEYDKESGGCALFGGCSRSYISLGAKSRVLTVTAHLDEYFEPR